MAANAASVLMMTIFISRPSASKEFSIARIEAGEI
jgi:hypothetical protein